MARTVLPNMDAPCPSMKKKELAQNARSFSITSNYLWNSKSFGQTFSPSNSCVSNQGTPNMAISFSGSLLMASRPLVWQPIRVAIPLVHGAWKKSFWSTSLVSFSCSYQGNFDDLFWVFLTSWVMSWRQFQGKSLHKTCAIPNTWLAWIRNMYGDEHLKIQTFHGVRCHCRTCLWNPSHYRIIQSQTVKKNNESFRNSRVFKDKRSFINV